ncbi:MAG: sensor histidine kinase [Sphingobacteriales bacterium]
MDSKLEKSLKTRAAELEKELAEKKRDLDIEVALERTRTQSMVMQHSNELDDTLRVFHEQVLHLGIKSAFSFLWLPDEEKDRHIFWAAWAENNAKDFKSKAIDYPLDRNEPATAQCLIDWKGKDPVVSYRVPPEGVEGYFAAWQELIDGVEQLKPEYFKGGLHYVEAFMKYGCFGVMVENSLAEDEKKILGRVAVEFERTYTRFLDLQKAEAQAREANIEAALEKVRSRSLAMHKSDELKDVVAVVAEKLQELGIVMEGAVIGIPAKDNKSMMMWSAMTAHMNAPPLYVPFGHPLIAEVGKAWEIGVDYFAKIWSFEEKDGFWKWAFENSDFKYLPDFRKDQILAGTGYAMSAAFSKNSGIIIPSHTGHVLSDKDADTLKRFAKVFEQAYIRFMDLEKAEVQAREGRIQLALERVRARTMAMQKSEELHEVIQLIFDQLRQLDFNIDSANFSLNYRETDDFDLWIAVADAQYPTKIWLPYIKHPLFDRFKKAKDKADLYTDTLSLQEKNSFFKHLFKYAPPVTKKRKALIFDQPGFARSVVFMKNTVLTIINYRGIPFAEAENNILLRFGQVFDQTYTRFKDLEQAEEQAREAQIQLGLERVRAKAMAMQTSEGLNELIGTVFSELTKLDFVLTRCLIMIFDPETKASRWWMANSELPAEPMNYLVQNHRNPAYDAYLKAWKERNLKWRYALKGKVKRDWDDFLFVDTELAQLPMPVIAGMKAPEQVLLSASFNNFGCLTLVSLEPLSDEHSDIMLRFAKVFDMCYTRFNDLKQAEAQIREAQIETALEKVRSRSLAMHKSDELQEVVTVVVDKLRDLELPFDTAVIIEFKEESKEMVHWIANTSFTYSKPIVIAYSDILFWKDIWNARERRKDVFTKVYNYEENRTNWKKAFETTAYSDVPEDRKALILGSHGLSFSMPISKNSAICLTSFSGQVLSEKEMDVLKRLGRVFEQAYVRFLDLQKVEEQSRESQIQLALERVRARTMAMQKSEELAETVFELFQQFKELGENPDQATIGIVNEEEKVIEYWVTMHGKLNHGVYKFPVNEPNVTKKIYEAWKKHKQSLVIDLSGKELLDFMKFRAGMGGAPVNKAEQRRIINVAFFSKGLLNVQSNVERSEESIKLLERFAGVFDGTYTRFLDLKQAEAQAREAEIQLALERVRARTMAMQHSEELAETAMTLFQQFNGLGVMPERIFIGTINDDTRSFDFWGTQQGGRQMSPRFKVGADATFGFRKIYAAWKEKKKEYTVVLKDRHLDEHIKYVRDVLGMPMQMNLIQEQRIMYNSFFSKGLLMIVTPETQSQETLNLLERFAGVFDSTYRRFLDLQKAEAQAKESQIQLALERVRARTMAMQRSEELAETATVLFQQLHSLDVTPERVFIGVPDDQNRTIELWGTEQGGNGMSKRFEAHADGAYSMSQIFEGWEEKKTELTVFLSGEHLDEHINYVANIMNMPVRMELVQDHRILYCTYFSKGMFVVVTPDVQSEETLSVLRRFAAVFDQTYTRFLDLKKAEAQAREGQIQLGLERVRAAAMAMHNSKDVGNATALMFSELYKLDITTIRCGICVVDGTARQMEVWSANSSADGTVNRGAGKLDMTAHPLWLYLLDAWKKKIASFSYELKGKELEDYYQAIKNAPNYEPQQNIKVSDLLESKQYCNCFLFNEGCLFTFTKAPFSPETSEVLEKFAAVFGLTYRRYLDLTKAEAQAREAQIESALERVRSKTMAMHNSADVGETVTLMFNELIKLGVEKMARCGIAIPDDKRTIELWTAKFSEGEKAEIIIGHIDTGIHPMLGSLYDAWKSKQPTFEHILKGDDLVNYITALNNSAGYPIKYDMKAWGGIQYHNDFFFAEGMVFAFTSQPLSTDTAAIFKRFAGVFGQTYRRYLDLKKAEANAREAQIEAALERVRAKAMAMRSSDDLNATANTVFIELRKLGVDLVRCGVGLLEKQTRISTIHAATNTAGGASLELLGKLNMEAHPVLVGIYKHWRQNEDFFPVLEGKSLKDYYKRLREDGIPVPELKSGEKQYGYFFQFPDGCLYAWSGKQESEDTLKTLKKFTTVIGLTYTRYMELQKAESNTKEAIKQASLDRVRAEIASMRKRSDLERITPLIWDELTILGIPFIRCGVFIMDEEQKLIHTFLSTPDGKAIGAFHVPYDTSENFEKIVYNWRHKEPYLDHWNEEAFSRFADTLVKQGAIASKAQYMRTLPHEGIHLNFLPFLQGMLYVGNNEPLVEDNIALIQAVAEAFSTAYARYEDFNKLEAAKEQVDNTLTQLKATQTKLIQSEKMASLGELTAGIAHEIQNPLNFVNNFSEVSAELIDEMDEELDKGDIEEAKAIANDIKENLQKIRHHGGRADGIVKGMLQHSRIGGGEKQPTNINTLADEFMRLSYHGLRAKDKVFNAELVTHFDPDLPKINVIGQDIGRVLLNLFNNAFYAVNEKKKMLNGDYKPEVTVTTSTENGQVIIKVKDNGVGMPEHIKEKIMQPFFTTKPTGEGTGLGLSLSYDMIVKGHGGSINVDTKEGEFTEFTVLLPN